MVTSSSGSGDLAGSLGWGLVNASSRGRLGAGTGRSRTGSGWDSYSSVTSLGLGSFRFLGAGTGLLVTNSSISPRRRCGHWNLAQMITAVAVRTRRHTESV